MNNQPKRTGPTVTVGLSVLIGMAGLLAILAMGGIKSARQPFGLGDYSRADLPGLEQAFAERGDEQDLLVLLKALCYRAEVEGDQSAQEKILMYGNELYRRAKAEELDLSKIDDEKVMLELLRLLKKYGAG